jgi:hypothetical protein
VQSSSLAQWKAAAGDVQSRGSAQLRSLGGVPERQQQTWLDGQFVLPQATPSPPSAAGVAPPSAAGVVPASPSTAEVLK